MNHVETVQLVRIIQAICPAQKIDKYTPDAWQPILADTTYADATAALAAIARSHDTGPLFVDPRQILNQVRKTKADTYARTQPQTPPPQDPKKYLTWARNKGREIPDNNGTMPAIKTDILSPEKSRKYRAQIRAILARSPQA